MERQEGGWDKGSEGWLGGGGFWGVKNFIKNIGSL